jgi:hypothetical protein
MPTDKNPTVTISGELDLSHIPKENFNAELPLRVVATREGEVLGSTVIKTPSNRERVPFEVAFEPPFVLGGRLPCPVTLVVGPNLGDRELLALETVSQVVELMPRDKSRRQGAGAKAAAAFTAKVKVGTILVEPHIYLCWLICCRTYTIRGRVVCRRWQYNPIARRWSWCDEPVPGATVEAYDVDCFWWWCRRDLIKTATTALDGSFQITFTWCCLRWLPWLLPNWSVDPDLLRRIRELLAVAKIPVPPTPPGPDPDPAIFQQLFGSAASLPGAVLSAAAQPRAFMSAAPGPAAPVSAEALQALLPPSPELAALQVWPWAPWRDCAPDVVFRVTQPCNGVTQVIYTETNAQTRWNIPTSLNVTLLANDKACCVPRCHDPECPECLKLTWIGCTPVDQIGVTAGPPDLRGYAYAGLSLDRPFYGSLQMRGAVGWDVDYFKVQYSQDGGLWTDLPVPAFAGFARSYWDGTNFVAVPFNPITKNGQTVIVSRRHYEDLHAGIPRFGGAVIWNDFDTLFYFDTTHAGLTPDALYQLRFVGYDTDAADDLNLLSARTLPTCGQATDETVFLRIDNQAANHPVPTPLHPCGSGTVHLCTNEPDCYIRSVCKNEGQPDQVCIAACDIVRLNPTDTLTIHFSVTCPPTLQDGHLGGYWMRAEYGVAQVFDIGTGVHGTFDADPTFEVGPDYSQALVQGAPRPHWYGGDYKVTVRGSDFPMCCAYLLRLWAWKRTTNGCSDPSVTHWNQFEITFTVLRPELCPNICPDEPRRLQVQA